MYNGERTISQCLYPRKVITHLPQRPRFPFCRPETISSLAASKTGSRRSASRAPAEEGAIAPRKGNLSDEARRGWESPRRRSRPDGLFRKCSSSTRAEEQGGGKSCRDGRRFRRAGESLTPRNDGREGSTVLFVDAAAAVAADGVDDDEDAAAAELPHLTIRRRIHC